MSRSDDDEIQCNGATIDHSATEMDLGGTNTTLPPLSLMWFADYHSGDFHLTPSGTSVFATVAQRQTGDPPLDIDGDPRPAMDGDTDHAGADLP